MTSETPNNFIRVVKEDPGNSQTFYPPTPSPRKPPSIKNIPDLGSCVYMNQLFKEVMQEEQELMQEELKQEERKRKKRRKQMREMREEARNLQN